MRDFVERCKTRPSTAMTGVLLLLSLLFNVYASGILNQSYAESAFPVPYYEAQLSFDPEKLKGWYAALIEQNTLSRYIRTQHIDFLFIASTLLLHFFALLFVSRLLPISSRWQTRMVICAVAASGAPAADALENVVSYVMLADPLHFPAYLAYVYSTFATIKFSMFVFAYAAAAVGLVLAFVYWVNDTRQRWA